MSFACLDSFDSTLDYTSLAQAIQHVFQKSGYNYTKQTSQNFMIDLMTGPGIVSALGRSFPGCGVNSTRGAHTILGEDHQRHRKIMHPAFSAPQLRNFLPLFQRIAGKVGHINPLIAAGLWLNLQR